MADNNRTTEVLERLTEGIEQLTNSGSWEDWLTMQSRFHRYSFNNTLLILLQTEGRATRVAGFHAWRQLGRNVRKGEKGIRILAPMTRKVRDDDKVQDQDPGARILMGFKAVPVFDIAQTDGEPLPEIASRLQGDDPQGAYAGLVEVARSIAYADGHDGARWVGLATAQLVTARRSGYVVAPEPASEQINRETKLTGAGAQTQGHPERPPADPDGTPAPGDTGAPGEAGQPGDPTFFYGLFPLDTVRGIRQLEEILRSVVQHLSDAPGGSVELTLEVNGTSSGFDERVRRVVIENAKQLGARGQEFE